MTISIVEMDVPTAERVTVTDDILTVELSDGRALSVPLAWYPRLAQGTAAERAKWRLIGRGQRIHWPDLDEDISVEGLVAGRPSGESQTSFRRWVDDRQQARVGRGQTWKLAKQEWAAFKQAIAELRRLMAQHGISEDEVVREFDALRHAPQ